MAVKSDGFTTLSIVPNADGALQNLDIGDVVQGPLTVMTTLASGTTGGKPTVGVFIELPDKRIVFGETTLALFLTAARIFAAEHGEAL
jgi:hypothetical protein